jgi:A/G-specific adenine glycosylase
LPYYSAFVKKFPSVFELARAKEKTVLNLWQGLGYYSRARNLHFTAKHVVEELNGVFPNNYEELLKLKGVGDYTASAIASICYNEATPVVDGNVYRFLSRYYGIRTPINSSKAKKEFKDLAKQLIDVKNPAEFNQAIMEFGSRQCKPQSPDCTKCPFNNKCAALQTNSIRELPVKLKAKKVVKRYFNYLVFLSEDQKTTIEQRNGNGIWEKLYQFPLIETPQVVNLTLIKKNPEFQKMINGKKYSISEYNDQEIIHKLSHQHLYTKFWIVNIDNLNNKGIPLKNLKSYPFPTLINNFINEFNF